MLAWDSGGATLSFGDGTNFESGALTNAGGEKYGGRDGGMEVGQRE